MKVLVTGASGFVGSHVVADFASRGHQVVALAGRTPDARQLANVAFHHGDLAGSINLAPLLKDIDVVVHLAGKAHARDAATQGSYDAYRPLNRDAVGKLAQASVAAGVTRFVLLSTIHVNGRASGVEPFRETSMPEPAGAYGQSKFDGERLLIDICRSGTMEYCIVRPPLIVGHAGKANLASLMKLVGSGLPLPFATLNNRRSVVGLRNLSEFLMLCATHPQAADALFLIADEPAVSTGQLAGRIASAMGKPIRQFPMPSLLWRLAAKSKTLERKLGALWESLEIDSGKARDVLGWQQIHPLDTAITDLAAN